MRGSYTIKIHNQRVTYTLWLERNITIICGDSATGKTTLYNSVAQYEELGEKSGVIIDSARPCRILRGKSWYEELSEIRASFVFVDEGSSFLNTREFAQAISGTDNYYVFITRENLYQLPYSVNSILELKRTTSRFKHTYNRTYPKYDVIDNFENLLKAKDCFLTEDSASGYDFFSYLADKNGLHCLSAKGKGNVLNRLRDIADKRSIVIADGAAFGADMAEVYGYARLHPENVLLYLPESFEWLILSSGIIRDKEIEDILNAPADAIDSESFISWERFFAHLLQEKTANTDAQYSKSRLSKFYLRDKNVEKILNVIEHGR